MAMFELADDTNTSDGSSARDVSALTLEFVEAFQRAQRSVKPAVYRAKGGNQQIPEGMAKRLKGGVRLGQQVSAIESDAARGRFRFRSPSAQASPRAAPAGVPAAGSSAGRRSGRRPRRSHGR
jgi:hypothetical protein